MAYPNIGPGSGITIISGARFRRVSDDGKSFLDQNLNEGALVEKDMPAKIVSIVEAKATSKIAYVVEALYEGKTIYGWTYEYEIVPSSQTY